MVKVVPNRFTTKFTAAKNADGAVAIVFESEVTLICIPSAHSCSCQSERPEGRNKDVAIGGLDQSFHDLRRKRKHGHGRSQRHATISTRLATPAAPGGAPLSRRTGRVPAESPTGERTPAGRATARP